MATTSEWAKDKTTSTTLSSSSITTTTTATTTPDLTATQHVRERRVPTPRPGELLIYDCRPVTLADHPISAQNKVHSQGSNNSRNAFGKDIHTPSTADPVLLNRNNNISNNNRPSSAPPTPTPTTGSAIFSSPSRDQKSSLDPTSSSFFRPIRCLQWNIERNYKPKEILDTLTKLDADIFCIQEIDIGCHRSGHERNHFLEICASQGLYGGFVPEFWELEHPGRKDRDQGGGVHGNAILSRWPINGFRVLDHVHHAYEWERDGHKLNEPRLGRRFTIVADIQTPSGPLLCYCAHLEVFTGIIGRISAISDILADSELYSERYPYQILFGDLNTISHSIARLAKTISTDQYRIGSIGFQEAEWWDHNLWSWHVEDGEFNLSLATGGWSWLRRFGVLGIGISSALLHAGTKDSGETRSGFWHSDRKYSNWLRMLVQAGLDKVKLARQQQLTVDSLVTVEKNNQNWHNRHGCISQLAAVEAVSTSNTALTDSKQTTDESMDDLASERSYQEDGSMVLIGRPRSPSIITLESSLLDKNESMSTSSWPLPTSPIGYNDHSHENGESEDEDNVLVHVYDTTIQRKKQSKAKGTSSPSTPSPTLRLIPPTPKERRSLAQGEEGDEIYYNEEERGVVLHYGKGESDTEEEDDGEEHGSWRRNARRNANDNDNDHSYDHSYDHNVFTTKNTTRATTMTTTTTTTTTTTATTTAAIALMAKMSEKEDSQQTSKEDQRSRHYPFDQEHEYKQTKEEHGEETPTKTETFQDPQPPFLLSTLSHATLGTRRLWSGFTPLVLHQARNPGFYDPWSARDDLTLHNPNFFGILKAKLDYTLLMNLRCVSREMGNHDYSASDHKWLLVEVEFERQFRTGHDDDDQRVPANNDDDDGVDDNDDNGIAVHTKDSSERVYELPSRTQRYLWWRERRHEWDQTVQPHPSATRPGYAKRTKDLYRQNPLLQQHRRQQQQQQQQQQEKNLSDTRSNVISGTSLMTAAVAVVVGGLFWWHKK